MTIYIIYLSKNNIQIKFVQAELCTQQFVLLLFSISNQPSIQFRHYLNNYALNSLSAMFAKSKHNSTKLPGLQFGREFRDRHLGNPTIFALTSYNHINRYFFCNMFFHYQKELFTRFEDSIISFTGLAKVDVQTAMVFF